MYHAIFVVYQANYENNTQLNRVFPEELMVAFRRHKILR